MANADVRLYKLGKNYEKFSGLLNGLYPVKNGIVTIPPGAKDPKPLIEHYGAVPYSGPEASAKSETPVAK